MGLAEFEFLVANMTEALNAPDEHFDCIHMLSESHWAKLKHQVATHAPEWREALAYVLSQGPTHEALPLLSTLLRDAHANVAQQAALSLVDLADLEPGLAIPEVDLDVPRWRRLGKHELMGHHCRMAKPAIDLAALTPEEKFELIDDLWGSLKPEDFVLTDEQQAELDRRLDRVDRDGPVGTSWEAVCAKMTPSRS